jgi:uncharacterized membrane protein
MCGLPHKERGIMKTRNLITAVISIIAGAITVWKFGTSMFGILSGANVAIIMAVGGLFVGGILDRQEEKRQGYVVADERSTQLQGKAGRAAFIVGNYIWLALLWYEFLSENMLQTPKIGSPPIVLVGLLLQVGVYFVAMYHYGKNMR